MAGWLAAPGELMHAEERAAMAADLAQEVRADPRRPVHCIGQHLPTTPPAATRNRGGFTLQNSPTGGSAAQVG